MHDTEGITTIYSDLVLGEDEDTEDEPWDSDSLLEQSENAKDESADYDLVPEGRGEEEEVFDKRGAIIRAIPSAITPLASASDWSP